MEGAGACPRRMHTAAMGDRWLRRPTSNMDGPGPPSTRTDVAQSFAALVGGQMTRLIIS